MLLNSGRHMLKISSDKQLVIDNLFMYIGGKFTSLDCPTSGR